MRKETIIIDGATTLYEPFQTFRNFFQKISETGCEIWIQANGWNQVKAPIGKQSLSWFWSAKRMEALRIKKENHRGDLEALEIISDEIVCFTM